MTEVTYHQGDVIAAAIAHQQAGGLALILHGCNDVGAWGAGFTAALDAVSPHVGRNFRTDRPALGTVTWDRFLDNGPSIANCVTQHGVGVREGHEIPFRYHALADCLDRVATALAAVGEPDRWAVFLPRIGCGLAGATWEQVGPFVDRFARTVAPVPVRVYDL